MKTPPKIEYSEDQAAAMLGVTVDQLRALVKNHIAKGEDLSNSAMPIYHASDLVLLRVLARLTSPAQAVHA
jgi:hypothetical protein